MGLLINLVVGAIHLGLLATDLVFLCLLLRMLSLRWPVPGLLAFNSLSRPLVEWFTGHVDRISQRAGSKPLSERTSLFVGMLVLSVLRMLVVVLCAGSTAG